MTNMILKPKRTKNYPEIVAGEETSPRLAVEESL